MKPIAFRIRDFKSIKDSGICELSKDGISVLAGQNESGKTAILTALRDFDLEEDEQPETPEYWPDGQEDPHPRVSVQFAIETGEIERFLSDGSYFIPSAVSKALGEAGTVWFTRDLPTGEFKVEDDLHRLWEQQGTLSEGGQEPPPRANTEAEEPGGPTSEEAKPLVLVGADEIGGILRSYWPVFVYFDSFSNRLPRSVPFSELQRKEATSKSGAPTGAGKQNPATVPEAVRDLLALADIDLGRIEEFSKNDKRLDNYLENKSGRVTGDFLTYWTQTVDGEQKVDLRVEGRRNEEGELQLHFFVLDEAKHFPEQRSKGFLWFLSFYLRLAASHKRWPSRTQFLLIDEPGSYLHARAQQDVLKLFEEKLVKKDQIVYSTHSPVLIPGDRLHRVRLVVRGPQGWDAHT